MTLIEKLDNTIIDFYRSHNYLWPQNVVMSQTTMDELEKEIHSLGYFYWKKDKFNHVPLTIDDNVADGDFRIAGAPELEHCKCRFCGRVDKTDAQWHRLDDGFLCESCYRTALMGLEVDFAARAARVEKHNRAVKSGLGKIYLKYYGDYLFNTAVKSAYDN